MQFVINSKREAYTFAISLYNEPKGAPVLPMIDSDSLKHTSDVYQAARKTWDTAMAALSKANTSQMSPLALQGLYITMQQAHEAVFSAGNELAEEVAAAIKEAEREARE